MSKLKLNSFLTIVVVEERDNPKKVGQPVCKKLFKGAAEPGLEDIKRFFDLETPKGKHLFATF